MDKNTFPYHNRDLFYNLKVEFTPISPYVGPTLKGRILYFGTIQEEKTLTSSTKTVNSYQITNNSTVGNATVQSHTITGSDVVMETKTVAYCYDRSGQVYVVDPVNIRVFHNIQSDQF